MRTVTDALVFARDLHRDGRVRDAAMIYRDFVVVEPDHALAVYIMGVIEYKRWNTN